MSPTDDRAPLTLRQAADELKLSPDTVRRWIKAGFLPAYRVGRQGQYRITKADLRDAAVRRP